MRIQNVQTALSEGAKPGRCAFVDVRPRGIALIWVERGLVLVVRLYQGLVDVYVLVLPIQCPSLTVPSLNDLLPHLRLTLLNCKPLALLRLAHQIAANLPLSQA